MKLSQLMRECKSARIVGVDTDVQSICCDSTKLTPKCLFVCLSGGTYDGHNFVGQAEKSGAAALLVTHSVDSPLPQIVVPDTRSAMSYAAGEFYGNPSRSMCIIAVVGTNGKTTTAHIMAAIARQAGYKVCLIGTAGTTIGSSQLPPTLTTPDPIDLQRTLAIARLDGCDMVVMEVSAHAIALKKLDGVVVDCAVFTNLSQDHLDYFHDMKTYGDTKKSYFCERCARRAVVNIDDALGKLITAEADIPVTTYGTLNPSDAFAIDYTPTPFGTDFVLNIEDNLYDIQSPLKGKYNMYNVLAAATASYVLGIPLSAVAEGVKKMPDVPGRSETVKLEGGATVIIDFAHTPDGIQNVLTGIKEYAEGKIITVFGCGGNRDSAKRPIMGGIAVDCSDYCIVTSDNPRLEDPVDIIGDIVAGIGQERSDRYEIVVDRSAAVKRALELAKKGDIVAILGKGDESYMDVGGKKVPYNDRTVVSRICRPQK